jgi:hypothetical protein
METNPVPRRTPAAVFLCLCFSLAMSASATATMFWVTASAGALALDKTAAHDRAYRSAILAADQMCLGGTSLDPVELHADYTQSGAPPLFSATVAVKELCDVQGDMR